MTPQEFLRSIADLKLTPLQRALGLLWFVGLYDHELSLSAAQICREVATAGYGQQNRHRLARALESDGRTSKWNGGFRIRVDRRQEFDAQFAGVVEARPVRRSNALLPVELFAGTRGYIEKVVAQVNVSFEEGLFDCCAVMCRRLLETLVIEVYEANGLAEELKCPDGTFKMFAGLLQHVEKEKRFNVGRNALEGLKAFKRLGDQSAHDRRYNARFDDLNRVRDGIRVAAEDLLHLSGLASLVTPTGKVANA
jgi:hypothetical protein